jgi:hypothetical protein
LSRRFVFFGQGMATPIGLSTSEVRVEIRASDSAAAGEPWIQ